MTVTMITRLTPAALAASTTLFDPSRSGRVSPRLNGKVERSRRSDQEKFYQPLSYKGDVDLGAKLDEWEAFYSFNRPHGAFNGKTPYKALREKL